ncbi:Type 1 phosphatases regulator ypi-1 like protein [Zalerion maritima]|uniref:Type 1 phosphatases regulator n=1 Tax=Zalerion maritima TaxID=339359 RepID=A0AAD5WW38_9PEZI|nr:Type 1 phosphatases regulator ypi-1 like protein [Zalerion maritima]
MADPRTASTTAPGPSTQANPNPDNPDNPNSLNPSNPGSGIARTATPSSGSQTVTQSHLRSHSRQPILRLRGANLTSGPRVQWADDVVDNEGLGRKKSKVCCIYHRPRAVDESSDSDSSSSSSSSSSSDSDSNFDPQDADKAGKSSSRNHRHSKGHGHGRDHGDDGAGCRRDPGNGKGKGKKRSGRKPSPNAYEKMPRYDAKPGDGGTGGGGGRPMGA